MSLDVLGTVRDISERRLNVLPTPLLGEGAGSVLPSHFPASVWAEQVRRYTEYWDWFSGKVLLEIDGYTQENKPVYKYPLQINPIRNFARKHCAILMGEAQDGPDPFVKTAFKPMTKLTDQPPSDEEKRQAASFAKLVNRIWEHSGGRALQQENGTLSQFLGGCVFQLSYVPQRDELTIPLVIKNVIPDFFLPIWSSDNYWDLLEAFVIYKIPAAVAVAQYGVENNGVWSTYVEHWRKDCYSIAIDGKFLSQKYAVAGGREVEILYKDLENPFGFVPFVYIPHLREGDFFGPSMVEDVRGLVKELNSSYADIGDAIKTTVHRKRYVTNLGTNKPTEMLAGRDNWVINLGTTPPSSKHPPEIKVEEPPAMAQGLTNYPEYVWETLLREANLSEIFFGKDEGSQRSALTLAFRMLPTTSHIRAERTLWEIGLNTLATMILLAIVRHPELRKAALREGVDVPADFRRNFRIHQEWSSMVPRDREQMVNEIILRRQTDLISPQRAIEKFGDVDNVEDEIEQIKKWLEEIAEIQAKFAVKPGQDGKGAQTSVLTPVASSGLENSQSE